MFDFLSHSVELGENGSRYNPDLHKNSVMRRNIAEFVMLNLSRISRLLYHILTPCLFRIGQVESIIIDRQVMLDLRELSG